MSPKLKPLLLPQLVEERRRQDDLYAAASEAEPTYFYTDNNSSSDITSPATPTFSHRGGFGHMRYASSTSSLDLVIPSPSFSECPASPLSPSAVHTFPTSAPTCAATSSPIIAAPVPIAVPTSPASVIAPSPQTPGSTPKRPLPLPDVQEGVALEEEEEEEQDMTMLADHDLYDCLCDEPCSHGRNNTESARRSGSQSEDFGLDFLNEGDAGAADPPSRVGSMRDTFRRRRAGGSVSAIPDPSQDSAFSGLTLRFGSRIQALSRWRSQTTTTRRTYVNLIGAPASEPALSRAPSSRSSSLSSPAPPPLGETTYPMTPPSLSFYGSTESINHMVPVSPRTAASAAAAAAGLLDIDQDDVRRSLERDRSLAATPLLPPMFLDRASQPPTSPLPPSLQPSPLESPTIASPVPSSIADGTLLPTTPPMGDNAVFPGILPSASVVAMVPTPVSSSDAFRSPPLSSKLSVSSFQSPRPVPNVVPSPSLELRDEWSDRLGHANYTILPRPYHPDNATANALRHLRADWSQARVNYTKHLVRIGEHYGMTSNTYVLTEAKWAETEREWKAAHDAAVRHVLSRGNDKECARVSLFRLPDDVSSTVPRILDAEGKFPNMGDEDIVGPMIRATLADEKQKHNNAIKFWRSLVGKVSLRK